MKRAGIRASSTPIIGSHAIVSLSTTRGSRPYQCISAWISVNESPGPAWRQQTRSGLPGWASGDGPSVLISRASTRRHSRKKIQVRPCTRS